MRKKMFIMIFFILMILIGISSISHAYTEEIEIYPIAEVASDFDDLNYWKPNSDSETTNETVSDMANKIIGGIRNAGIIISVIALMIIGIRTMVGSASEKSQYKEALPGYLLGVFMIAAVTAIPSIIYNLIKP